MGRGKDGMRRKGGRKVVRKEGRKWRVTTYYRGSGTRSLAKLLECVRDAWVLKICGGVDDIREASPLYGGDTEYSVAQAINIPLKG